MLAQMKIGGNSNRTVVNALGRGNKNKISDRRRYKKHSKESTKECGNCGTEHDRIKRELCPAYLKTCRKCGKLSYFAVKCCSKKKEGKDSDTCKFVRAVDNQDSDSEEFYADHISVVDLDDSQLVTVKLESGNYLRFQTDTGAHCNAIPVELYRKATKDYELEYSSHRLRRL